MCDELRTPDGETPYSRYFKAPKWSRLVRFTDCPRRFRRILFPEWGPAEHRQVSAQWARKAEALAAEAAALREVATCEHGWNGSLQAGGVCTAWPEHVLRPIASREYLATEYRQRARAHAEAARYFRR